MAKVDNTLSEIFGVAPIGEPEKVPPPEIPETKPGDVEDFEFVRQKLHGLLHEGTTAFETLAQIAKSEEKISAFSTLNEMLSNLSDISIKLLEIQEKKNKLLAPQKGQQSTPNTVTNNAVFVGSTADLARMINDNFEFPIIDNAKETTPNS